MNLSALSIKNPVFAWMLMFALLFFGALSYRQMGISQNPDVDFPYVNVGVDYVGAAPEVMEKDVVDPIEGVLVSVEGIKKISSSARTGSANISVEFELDKDIDVAVQEVQTAVARARRNLPDDVEPPIVTKSNPEDRPIMWLAVRSSEISRQELMHLVKTRIADQFTTLSGVSEVTLGGYIEPALNVKVSSEKLQEYALTAGDIVNTIRTEHVELPAGRVETAEVEKVLRMQGEAMNVEEFREIQIKKRGGGANYVPLKLSEVADIDEGLEEVRRISRVMGSNSVGLGIRKQRGANTVEVGNLVKSKAEIVREMLPEGVELSVNFDSTPYIEDSVDELIFTLILAALLTAFVCWTFLGNLSSTLNIVLAIPTSIVGTFIIINAMGFTLNSFTLLGLTLAIGIVVDDAIIVLENIMRHREMGKGKKEAALDGSKEILFAVLATTAALVAIFLPVTFMQGIIGKFFFEFAATICVAVSLSSVEALTLTPMRCSKFLGTKNRTTKLGFLFDKTLDMAKAFYEKLLIKALNNRIKIVVISVIIFAVSLILITKIQKEFAPSQDESRLFIQYQTPIESSMQFTDKKMQVIEDIIMAKDYTLRYFVAIGGFGGGQSNVAFMFLTLKDLKDRPINPETNKYFTQDQIAKDIRESLKDIKEVRTFVRASSSSVIGGGRGFQVEFSVRGPEWAKLLSYSEQIENKMRDSEVFNDVNRGRVEAAPELWIRPDRLKAKELGVSVSDIAETVRVLYGGFPAALYSKGGQRYDVRVQLQDSERDNLDSLSQLYVRNNRGELVNLSKVTQVEEKYSTPTITREDRVRSIGVSANPGEGYSQVQALQEAERIAGEILPKGYYIVTSGATQTMQESFQSLLITMILGIIVAYMVLGSQFNSFLDPFIVLLALPFALSGALVALYISGQTLNVYSMIGMILLMGIVKKNSILLVEFTNQALQRGNNVREALLEACPLRLRPILMTSFATIAAAIPAAVNAGPGAETRIPMAYVIIGGMFISTLFTLFVVPCVYSLASRFKSLEK